MFWLTEDGLLIYRKRRDARLASWGVPSNHRGTCILVSSDMPNVDPVDQMAAFTEEQARVDKTAARRLVSEAPPSMLETPINVTRISPSEPPLFCRRGHHLGSNSHNAGASIWMFFCPVGHYHRCTALTSATMGCASILTIWSTKPK